MLKIQTQKPKTGRGRRSKRPEITPHQAKQTAIRLLKDGLPPLAKLVIGALTTGGVLTASQLHRITTVSPRTLQLYHRDHFLDRLPISPSDLEALGFAEPLTDLRLYALGAVGLEIAQLQYGRRVPTGYFGYGVHRILHDVLVNETALRLMELAVQRGYDPTWLSRYEATVHDERGAPALEPDALLILQRDSRRRLYLVELHREDHGLRAEKKVKRYEQVYRDGRWRDEWETEEMPLTLVVFTHKAVGKGYKEAVANARKMGLRCTFLGKPWNEVVNGNDLAQWFDFNIGKTVAILEE